jgi:hypothetical protein
MTVSKRVGQFIQDWFGGHREHSLQRKVKTPFKNLEISYLVVLLSNLYRAEPIDWQQYVLRERLFFSAWVFSSLQRFLLRQSCSWIIPPLISVSGDE